MSFRDDVNVVVGFGYADICEKLEKLRIENGKIYLDILGVLGDDEVLKFSYALYHRISNVINERNTYDTSRS